MSIDKGTVPENKIKFRGEEDIESEVLPRLREEYGRYIYISDIFEAQGGKTDSLIISLGASTPHDLSDSMERDNVFKFIKIPDATHLTASKGGEYYSIHLPERSTIRTEIKEKKRNMIETLDVKMARHIYDKLVELPTVKTQLNPIIQILKWTRRKAPAEKSKIMDSLNPGNPEEYLSLLENLDYIRIEGDDVYTARKLDRFEFEEIRDEERDTMEDILGSILQTGYDNLLDKFQLSMLKTYPKYSNAYYYSAFERDDPNLYLDLEAVSENLDRNWGDSTPIYELEDKLEDLDRVGVLEKEGDYVTSDIDVYNEVRADIVA